MSGLYGYLIAGLVVLLLVAGSFFTGRWTAPGPDTAVADSIPALRTVVVRTNVDRVVTRRIVVTQTPDAGTLTTTDEREEERATTGHTETPPPPAAVAAVVKAAHRADWRVGALVGVQLGGLTTAYPEIKVQYGLEVERRLLGPVWFGIQGTSAGYVGGKLGVEF